MANQDAGTEIFDSSTFLVQKDLHLPYENHTGGNTVISGRVFTEFLSFFEIAAGCPALDISLFAHGEPLLEGEVPYRAVST